jgi:hypothetical protein
LMGPRAGCGRFEEEEDVTAVGNRTPTVQLVAHLYTD